MSEEGVTTVGSIIGKLRIDSSNWDAELDRAEARARELGSANPRLRIDSNAVEAVAALDTVAVEVDKIGAKSPKVTIDSNAVTAAAALASVTTAQDRLDAAQRAAANSAGTATIAAMRLEEIQSKGGATALQLAAAEEALAKADRNAEAAELRELAATEALNAAKAEAVRKSLEQAAAEETAAGGADKASKSYNGQISGMQAVIALSPAMLAAAAPIATSAVGLGSAFTIMGLSGALAIKGIKDAMEVGDSVGNTYAAGLATIKGNLDQLSGTAATHMLQGFSSVVGDINQDMPFLNQTVGTFAGLLGNVGGTALQGVLTGLEQMNPLLIAGGAELSKFVTWLFSFNNSNGFTQFIDYAITNLPPVMSLVENLVTLAGNILAAFAPLGPAVIGALNGITGALNALPLPVLAGLVTTVATIVPAFKLAGLAVATFGVETEAATGAVTLFGIASNLAVPVVGVLLAAVAGIGIAMASSAAGTQTASGAMANYTSELQASNGVIDDNIRKTAAKALVDNGAAQAAKDLGINTALLTPAVLGSADAQKQLQTQIDAVKSSYENSAVVMDMNGNVTHVVTQKQQDAYDAAVKLEKGISDQKGAFQGAAADQQLYSGMLNTTNTKMDAQTAATAAMAARYGMTVEEYQAANNTQQTTQQQLAQTTANMQLQNDAAGLLKLAWDQLNGKAISAAQAQNAFDSSLVNMGDHVNATGKKITFTTTSINDMSSASVALRGQLNNQVTTLEGVIEANGGLSGSTDAAKAQYADMRQQIIDNAVAHGVNRDAVTAYIDKILQVPKATKTTAEMDVDQAMANLATFQAHLDNLRDRTITVTERTIQDPGGMGSSVGGRANGSLAGGFATGGLIPQYHATGGSVASYLASGGSPFAGGPRGTDTVPTWLTPGEFVVNRDATARNRPALEAMNSGGTLTSASAQPQQMTMVGTLVLDSGEVLGTFRGIARAEANNAITAADRDSARRRVGV